MTRRTKEKATLTVVNRKINELEKILTGSNFDFGKVINEKKTDKHSEIIEADSRFRKLADILPAKEKEYIEAEYMSRTAPLIAEVGGDPEQVSSLIAKAVELSKSENNNVK